MPGHTFIQYHGKRSWVDEVEMLFVFYFIWKTIRPVNEQYEFRDVGANGHLTNYSMDFDYDLPAY